MLIRKLYESYAKGDLTEKRFKLLSGDYEREQEELEGAVSQGEQELAKYEVDEERVEQFLELAKRYTDFTELTTLMLDELRLETQRVTKFDKAEPPRFKSKI